jgi:hypothetical protein
MHNRVFHYCDKTMFFPLELFIQMHMVINISLDLFSWDLDLDYQFHYEVHYEKNYVIIYQ